MTCSSVFYQLLSESGPWHECGSIHVIYKTGEGTWTGYMPGKRMPDARLHWEGGRKYLQRRADGDAFAGNRMQEGTDAMLMHDVPT
jgi:hypothetical protein